MKASKSCCIPRWYLRNPAPVLGGYTLRLRNRALHVRCCPRKLRIFSSMTRRATPGQLLQPWRSERRGEMLRAYGHSPWSSHLCSAREYSRVPISRVAALGTCPEHPSLLRTRVLQGSWLQIGYSRVAIFNLVSKCNSMHHALTRS